MQHDKEYYTYIYSCVKINLDCMIIPVVLFHISIKAISITKNKTCIIIMQHFSNIYFSKLKKIDFTLHLAELKAH